MDKRTIELALEALAARKASLDGEIAKLRAQLSPRAKAAPKPAAKAKAPGKRGPRSKAARDAQSKRMKAYWENKKAAEAKEKPAGAAVKGRKRKS